MVDLRGSVLPRNDNDDVVKPFVCPLAKKQPHPECSFLLAEPAFEDVHSVDELPVQVIIYRSFSIIGIFARRDKHTFLILGSTGKFVGK